MNLLELLKQTPLDTDAIRAAVEPQRFYNVWGARVEREEPAAIVALCDEIDRLRVDAALGAAVRALPQNTMIRHCTDCASGIEWWHVRDERSGEIYYYGGLTPEAAIQYWRDCNIPAA